MAYIGASPTSAAFITDQFSGTGSQTAFTMSVAPATTSSMLVSITGVLQEPSTYSINGTTLTFSVAPPAGTGNISVRYLGIPASGVTTTAYRTVTEFTATAGQTTFSPPSYTPGFINVFRNGVRLGATNFTASNGTTVVLANAASVGDLIVTESFLVSSVLNALPITGGTINSVSGATPLVVQSNGVTGLVQTSDANVGIGTSTPTARLHVRSTNGRIVAESNVANNNPSLMLVSASNNRNWEVFSFGSNAGEFGIYDGVAQANRFLIDTSGRVTIPVQPSFEVSGAAGLTFVDLGGSNYRMVYATIHHNIGSHYNSSTGRFTAPVTGTYLFQAVSMGVQTTSPHIAFSINGTVSGGGGNYGSNNMWEHGSYSQNAGWIRTVHIIRLNANDTVAAHAYAYGSVTQPERCYFGGHLLG